MIASFKQLNNCFSITTPPSLEENLAPSPAHNDYSPHWGRYQAYITLIILIMTEVFVKIPTFEA